MLMPLIKPEKYVYKICNVKLDYETLTIFQLIGQ